MFCMKCGKETDETQVFCAECLSVMEKFPVKPGTPVQLPSRQTQTTSKKLPSRKKEISAERKLQRCKRVVVCLFAALLAALILWGITLGLLLKNSCGQEPSETKGQNYGTIQGGDTAA